MAICEFEFMIDALEQNAISVTGFTGKEEISRPFRFELDLLSTDKELAFEDIVNRPAKLVIRRNDGDEESIICAQVVDFGQRSETRSAAYYHAILVPRVWTLSYTFQSCVFQNKTVETIITDVLAEHGLTQGDVRFELTDSYSERDFCVQYRESDLDFICRLMEFEGMYFYFDHSGDQEVMVISDDRSNESLIDSTQASGVSYHQHEGNLAPDDIQTINEFIYNEKVVTGKVVLKDYNYRESEIELLGEAQINPEMPGMFYSYGSHFKDNTEGNRLAKIRNQEFECQRRCGWGKSDHVNFTAGFKFGMIDHYRENLNADYLLTAVHHSGFMIDGQGTYSNEFKCIPAEVQFRPERLTPEPRLPGILTAKVEGADDNSQYASIDELGRYKVRLPFDQGDESLGSASKPLRLMQPSTGSGHGMHFPVHSGTEMVWACIDGNVDRPIGLGTVPNSTQVSPVTAENNNENLLQTSSGHRLNMDDNAENPTMTLSSLVPAGETSSGGGLGGDGSEAGDVDSSILRGGMAAIESGKKDISGNTITLDSSGVDITTTVEDYGKGISLNVTSQRDDKANESLYMHYNKVQLLAGTSKNDTSAPTGWKMLKEVSKDHDGSKTAVEIKSGKEFPDSGDMFFVGNDPVQYMVTEAKGNTITNICSIKFSPVSREIWAADTTLIFRTTTASAQLKLGGAVTGDNTTEHDTVLIHTPSKQEIIELGKSHKGSSYRDHGITIGTRRGKTAIHGAEGVFIGGMYSDEWPALNDAYIQAYNTHTAWIPTALGTVGLAIAWSRDIREAGREAFQGVSKAQKVFDTVMLLQGWASSAWDIATSGTTLYGAGGVTLISPNATGSFSFFGHGIFTTAGIDSLSGFGTSIQNMVGGITLNTLQGGIGMNSIAPFDDITINAGYGKVQMSGGGIEGVTLSAGIGIGPPEGDISKIMIKSTGITLMAPNDIKMTLGNQNITVKQLDAKIDDTNAQVNINTSAILVNETKVSDNEKAISANKDYCVALEKAVITAQNMALELHN